MDDEVINKDLDKKYQISSHQEYTYFFKEPVNFDWRSKVFENFEIEVKKILFRVDQISQNVLTMSLKHKKP